MALWSSSHFLWKTRLQVEKHIYRSHDSSILDWLSPIELQSIIYLYKSWRPRYDVTGMMGSFYGVTIPCGPIFQFSESLSFIHVYIYIHTFHDVSEFIFHDLPVKSLLIKYPLPYLIYLLFLISRWISYQTPWRSRGPFISTSPWGTSILLWASISQVPGGWTATPWPLSSSAERTPRCGLTWFSWCWLLSH